MVHVLNRVLCTRKLWKENRGKKIENKKQQKVGKRERERKIDTTLLPGHTIFTHDLQVTGVTRRNEPHPLSREEKKKNKKLKKNASPVLSS